MGKGKNDCSKCEARHFPPTGKKCTLNVNQDLTKGQNSKHGKISHVVSDKKLHKLNSKFHQDVCSIQIHLVMTRYLWCRT